MIDLIKHFYQRSLLNDWSNCRKNYPFFFFFGEENFFLKNKKKKKNWEKKNEYSNFDHFFLIHLILWIIKFFFVFILIPNILFFYFNLSFSYFLYKEKMLVSLTTTTIGTFLISPLEKVRSMQILGMYEKKEGTYKSQKILRILL